MLKTHRHLISTIVIAFLLCLSPLPVTANNAKWNTEGRVIAISDIHGAFDEFVTLLTGAQLINDDGHWTGNTDHLVIVGDVLDRGAASRDVLEMIMRLETEAKHAGGMVHLVLGNHEIMNLVGDLRYVAMAEYARYTDVEDPEHRSAGLQKFKSLQSNKQISAAVVMEEFKRLHPPGFFGHSQLFSAEGALGKWLLTRPVIIKINDSVFVHGGLSLSMLGKSPGEINRLHHKVLMEYVSSREYFVSKGILGAATNFFDQPDLVEQMLEVKNAQETVTQKDQETGNRLINAYRSDIFAGDSPTWYRGNIGCSAAIEQDRLRLHLENLGARRLVVGHTPTSSRTIESRFNGMLIRVDTGILNSHYHGQPSATIIQGDKVTAYYPNSSNDNSISTQPRRVGPRPGRINLTDMELERILSTAPILSSEIQEDHTTLVTIDYEGHPIEARFTAARSKKRSSALLPEVAAYRLDQHLGLEMIAVAVARNVDGKSGVIRLDTNKLIDEDKRMARRLGDSAWCSLKDQFNMMYMFDILLHNKGRQRNAMRYTSSNMRLILTNNENTLGVERGAPRYLKSAIVAVPDYLKSQLQQMDAQILEDMLGDVLDAKRRKAILSRRNVLLKQSK
jgi:Calcineurin-like phosphoesterase